LGRKAILFVFSKIGATLSLLEVRLMEASEQKRSLWVRRNTAGYEVKALLIRSPDNPSKIPKAIPFCFSKLSDLGKEIK
jgi:hypothetical protein